MLRAALPRISSTSTTQSEKLFTTGATAARRSQEEQSTFDSFVTGVRDGGVTLCFARSDCMRKDAKRKTNVNKTNEKKLKMKHATVKDDTRYLYLEAK